MYIKKKKYKDEAYRRIIHLRYSKYDRIIDVIHKIQSLNATRATKIDRTCQQQNRYRQRVATFYVAKQFLGNLVQKI